MIDVFEDLKDIEDKEEFLRQAVTHLTEDKRRHYFKELGLCLKDPDTYAALTWSLVGGFHHLYLKKYKHFIVEFMLLLLCIISLINGFYIAVWGIVVLAISELPQLFFSQKIVRLYNYRVSKKLYENITHEHES